MSPFSTTALSCLESQLGHDDYLWLLRELYRIVLKTDRQRGTKRTLKQKIAQLEKECGWSPYLSTIPLEKLLRELEDAQYFYPISAKEITFPSFS